MSATFADAIVVPCQLDRHPNAKRAEAILAVDHRAGVERGAGDLSAKGRAIVEGNRGGLRALCAVEDLTLQTHEVGRALAERYQLSIHDAMIVASALFAGCETLWSEDMQDGMVVEGRLRVVNPFELAPSDAT